MQSPNQIGYKGSHTIIFPGRTWSYSLGEGGLSGSITASSYLVVGNLWVALLKWALVWLISPESFWKLQSQWSHWFTPPEGGLFPLCRLVASAASYVRPKAEAPTETCCHHSDLSAASVFSRFRSIYNCLRVIFRLSLNLFFCPPASLLPSFITPYNTCRGRRSGGFLATCPA